MSTGILKFRVIGAIALVSTIAVAQNSNSAETEPNTAEVKTVDDLKRVCGDLRGFRTRYQVEGIFEQLLGKNDDYNLEVIKHRAEGLLENDISPSEKKCLKSIAASIPEFKSIANQREKNCSQLEHLAYGRCLSKAERDEKDAEAKKQQSLDTQPSQRLKSLYLDYIILQACFKSREAFRVQYVTQQEMEAVRSVTKRNEQFLLYSHRDLANQKDDLWDQAKAQYGSSVFAFGLGASGTTYNSKIAEQCKTVAAQYTGDKKYQQEQIRKDF